MEGRVLDRLGALYLTKQDYDVATAFFILARNVFDKIKNLEIGRVEDHLELVRRDIGNDSFTELLERTKSQAHQIVDQAWTSDW